MSITLDGTLGITTPTYGGATSAEYSVPVTGFKNRIINGAMVIDQRNAGASVTPTNGQYLVDRWAYFGSQASKFTAQQGSAGAPAGFTNYLTMTVAAGYTVGASDSFFIDQRIEGFNVADFNWGTANAQTVTVSFKVYSSVSGTHCAALMNYVGNRSYVFTYSVPVANTWTTITATILGDTTGTWLTNNGIGVILRFNLGAGSALQQTANAWGAGGWTASGTVNVVSTTGNTFLPTGVQLEKGSTATSFDYRPYGTELALCQRYFEITNTAQISGSPAVSSVIFFNASFVVTKRTSPSNYGNGGNISFYQASNNTQYTGGSVAAINNVSVGGVEFQVASFAGLTAGSYGIFRPSTSQLSWSAEL